MRPLVLTADSQAAAAKVVAPNEQAMHEIAKLFGFENGIKGEGIARIWVEAGEHPAVNVLEVVSKD